MGRIQSYFERQFAGLLARSGRVDPAQGVPLLFQRAAELSSQKQIPLSLPLARLRVALTMASAPVHSRPDHFVCDAALGGLARWLRAAGYDASWNPHLDDAAVIREAARVRATLLTTDLPMMERGILRDGITPSIWLPPDISIPDQLGLVLAELRLDVRASRCMRCGGQLQVVDKALVKDRIPPKTWHWCDQYFLCERCGQLLWHGTHWQKIRRALQEIRTGWQSTLAELPASIRDALEAGTPKEFLDL